MKKDPIESGSRAVLLVDPTLNSKAMVCNTHADVIAVVVG